MALIVLDASVVIAHLDPADAHHAAARAALRAHEADDLRLPASAYAEALVEPAGKGRAAPARDAIRRLVLHIEPIGEAIAERAAALRAEHPTLRLPDALVVACGQAIGAEAVLTADRRWRRVSDRVRVI